MKTLLALVLCGALAATSAFAWSGGTWQGSGGSVPTPQPTFAYTAPTPQPTFAYVAPTPGPDKGIFTSTTGATNLATSGTQYFAISGVSTPNATNTNVGSAVFAITVRSFTCSLAVQPGTGDSRIFTLHTGSDTDWVSTCGETDFSCSLDTSGSAVAATQFLAVKSTVTGTSAASPVTCRITYSVD